MTVLDGKWNCVTKTPMGAQPNTFDLKTEGTAVTGTSTNSFGSLDLQDGKFEGDTFTWRLEMKAPFPMTLKGEAKVSGDTLEGQVAAGMFGKSPITGTRG